MTSPLYDVTLAAIPGDTDHHPRCPFADEDAVVEYLNNSEGQLPDCTCDDLEEDDEDERAYRRYEENRK